LRKLRAASKLTCWVVGLVIGLGSWEEEWKIFKLRINSGADPGFFVGGVHH